MMGTANERVLERSDLFAAHSIPAQREWTLVDLFSIFRRRRGMVVGWVLGMVALAGLYCMLATPRYLATGQIEVEKDDPGALGLDRSVAGGSAQTDTDALDTSMTLETDARILQSSTLALMVVKDLKLETTADYFPAHRRGVRIPGWVFFWRKPVEPMTVPLDAAPNRRYVVLKIFASHLKVAPQTGTRLIDVSYSSPDPQLASAVVNKLIGALQEYTFQSRFQATAQASTWLAGQLTELKTQTEQLQKTADRLEQGTGIYGDDASQNLVLARLGELNSALSAAEQDRILKQSIYQVAKSGDPELISGLAGNAAAGSTPAMTNSLALLQTLRAEQTQVQADIDKDNARYGSAYPMMAELHGELDGLNKGIQAEIKRIGERARTDYEIAQRNEDAAQAAFERQKQIANATNNQTVAYELAKQDADGSRNLYQGLLGKLKEAGVLAGLRSTNLTVVNAGMVPPTNHPHSPNVPLSFAAALAGGLFLGCAGALVQEATDRSVRSVDELERMLGVPLAGVVPAFERERRLPWMRRSGPVNLENGARGLRRSFALPSRGQTSQAVLITSAVPGDGKSRLAASLGISLARAGARVLLVDADLLCASLHALLEVKVDGKKMRGLAEALIAGGAAEVHACAQVKGLSVVCAGGSARDADQNTPWYAADLLASSRMDALMQQWRAEYDVVLLDSAPVLPVPDAASLARLCDRTLLAVRYGCTTMQAAQRSYRMIRQNLPERAGLDVVMNGVPENSPDYVAYYGYKGSGHGRRARANA
ncbi:MAG TPA: Wzz/FepE/Etk N-terminal domain-containing protein [Acidobacteriaceae bacterium]|nr:Wzz/FepE/Etk N-terminal domain-containing protein [Acidobacteriaceae bacterium]